MRNQQKWLSEEVRKQKVSKEGRSVLKTYPQSLARLVRHQQIQVGDRVIFDFHEKRYRQLTGEVVKINEHSYLVRLHERHLKTIQELFEFREGNGCVCVSQGHCRRV